MPKMTISDNVERSQSAQPEEDNTRSQNSNATALRDMLLNDVMESNDLNSIVAFLKIANSDMNFYKLNAQQEEIIRNKVLMADMGVFQSLLEQSAVEAEMIGIKFFNCQAIDGYDDSSINEIKQSLLSSAKYKALLSPTNNQAVFEIRVSDNGHVYFISSSTILLNKETKNQLVEFEKDFLDRYIKWSGIRDLNGTRDMNKQAIKDISKLQKDVDLYKSLLQQPLDLTMAARKNHAGRKNLETMERLEQIKNESANVPQVPIVRNHFNVQFTRFHKGVKPSKHASTTQQLNELLEKSTEGLKKGFSTEERCERADEYQADYDIDEEFGDTPNGPK